MAWFVEFEPDKKKDLDEFYEKYNFFTRRAVFEDYIEVAKITSDRQGDKADHNKNLEYFEKKFNKKSDENEYFIAYIVDKNDPEAT